MGWLNNFVSDFKPHKAGLKKILGDLEADIMEIMWERQKVSVRDVYEHLRLQKKCAYTTIMTVMGRLADKGLLSKELEGNAYLYSPSLSRKVFIKNVISEVLDGLFEDFSEPAVSHFVDRLSKEDSNKLDRLENLIKEKRKAE